MGKDRTPSGILSISVIRYEFVGRDRSTAPGRDRMEFVSPDGICVSHNKLDELRYQSRGAAVYGEKERSERVSRSRFAAATLSS